MELSAPKQITFIVSAIIAVIAAIIHYAHLTVPYVAHSGFTLQRVHPTAGSPFC